MRVYLKMACPQCLKEGYHVCVENWTHGGSCNGSLYLDENAYIHCDRCYRSAHLSRMELSCNSGRHKFVVMSTSGFAKAIMISGTVSDTRTLAWLQSVMLNIKKY